MTRHCNAAVGIALMAAIASVSSAAPAVALQDDPRLLQCPTAPAGILKTTGAAISNDVSVMYEAGFDPLAWHGSLKKRRIGFDAGGKAGVQRAEWDAADGLTAIEPQARRIYTFNNSNATVPFDWARLSASQQGVLNASDGLGTQRLHYLRGDRSLEQGNAGGRFRRRQALLGAIVNSTPVFVGPPTPALLEPGYQTFYQQYRQRAATVFVGANDGMLHAFDADSGRELFAYVPRALFPALSQLTRPELAHRAYVDGSIRVAEAHLGSEWKTVLVASLRGGAQAVFALDVTDAARFDEGAGALWEFTDADDPHMGHVIGTPAIAKFFIGVRKGAPSYRYFAVVSAGVNNDVDDGTGRFDADGKNALFLLALDKAPTEQWKVGSNYFKFVLPAGENGMANGLSEPALILDGDGVARHVYVGDLQGNLWRFDFTGVSPWTAALGAGTPKPVFIASDEHGRRQAITAKPAVVFSSGGYLLLFGTGRLLEKSDLAEPSGKQSIYAVQDDPGKRGGTIRRNELMKRTVAMRADGRIDIHGNTIPRSAGSKGWYVDLPQAGERVLLAADILGHVAYFDTLIPSTDPCRSALGRSYFFDTLSGLPPDNVVTGIPFDPDSSSARVTLPTRTADIAPRDASGKKKITIRRIRLGDDADAASEKAAPNANTPMTQTMSAGRLSWRELVDWDGVQK